MVEYICPNCGKKMDRKDTYNKHMARKKSCSRDELGIEILANEIKIQKKEIEELKVLVEKLLLK